ncbi:sulfurtransferase [Flagellimonas sp. DF-77]|uniref:sulfurtransferase n=1 Tax=Flagellimonas algarum TaxID=3230298 RepID=UPI0033986C59
MKTLVTADWLQQRLHDPNLIILDASVATNAHGQAFETFDRTIPKARKFDLKGVFRDLEAPYPNTVPRPEDFERECRKLGIGQNSEIVVFDHNGIYTSARVWWLFQIMGHANIAVLDGGLPQWIAQDRPTEKTPMTDFAMGDFKARFQADQVVSFKQVDTNTNSQKFLIVDARSKGRFSGTEAEPRKSLQSGHIPHSINLPFKEVLQDGRFKTKAELLALFAPSRAEGKEVVFSCGSGMTACILALANTVADGSSLKVFDGSWSEWAERKQLYTRD